MRIGPAAQTMWRPRHNSWAPERPAAGQNHERFCQMDGRGAAKAKLMWKNAGETLVIAVC